MGSFSICLHDAIVHDKLCTLGTQAFWFLGHVLSLLLVPRKIKEKISGVS